jgi:hypothetical protein
MKKFRVHVLTMSLRTTIKVVRLSQHGAEIERVLHVVLHSCSCDDGSAMRMVLKDTSVEQRKQRFAQSYVTVRLICDQRKEEGRASLNQWTWRFEMHLTREDDQKFPKIDGGFLDQTRRATI